MNNFHSLIGIINGINSMSINRLKATMGEMDPKHIQLFQSLEKFADNTGNFGKLRKAMQHIKPPSVPFLFVIFYYSILILCLIHCEGEFI